MYAHVTMDRNVSILQKACGKWNWSTHLIQCKIFLRSRHSFFNNTLSIHFWRSPRKWVSDKSEMFGGKVCSPLRMRITSIVILAERWQLLDCNEYIMIKTQLSLCHCIFAEVKALLRCGDLAHTLDFVMSWRCWGTSQ